jgi:hypothetical protein
MSDKRISISLDEYNMLHTETLAQKDTITSLTAEVEKKDAALKLAGTGLKAGVFRYADRDFHGNIIPGDEQYPWIKAMQIGLDAVTAALPPPPALSGDKP